MNAYKMNWQQLLSRKRFATNTQGKIVPISLKAETLSHNPYRSSFHIDYDRIVFSHAFRRLGRKTQVHPLAKGEHTHNRLTHSIEVSSVGRSLGAQVGGVLQERGLLPATTHCQELGLIVQVACLAHDLGNPPFGHIGEDALRQWFRDPKNFHYLQTLSPEQINDLQTYEGNAHSLRQVASLEKYYQQGGMRLTSATIGTLLKYPWTSSQPQKGRHKFNIYQTELAFIQTVAQELGLPLVAANEWARHPLSYLMETADDICYALIDLEDAVELEILNYQQDILPIIRQMIPHKRYQKIIQATQHLNEREQNSMLRGNAIGFAIEQMSQTFLKHYDDIMNGEFAHQDLIEANNSAVPHCLNEAKNIMRERVFCRRLYTEIATFPCLGISLDLLIPAVYQYINTGKTNAQQSLVLELLKNTPIQPHENLYQAYMKVLDYLGSMTDNLAAQSARELSGTNIK